MDRNDQPKPEPTPTPTDGHQQIGTDAEQTIHRPPAPTVEQHNATIAEARANGTLSRAWR